LRFVREVGTGHPRADGTWPASAMEYYTVFYGRGLMQLTWPANYEPYGHYRRFPPLAAAATYRDPRITHTSRHYWSDPRDRHGNVVGVPRQWFPRYDPEVVADDAFAACDSGGFYWVSKHIGGGETNINRVADRPWSTAAVGRISVLVNGGGFGYVERQSYAAFIKRYRDDDTSTDATETFQVTFGGTARNVFVDYAPQRP
jgi:hypothetical protein